MAGTAGIMGGEASGSASGGVERAVGHSGDLSARSIASLSLLRQSPPPDPTTTHLTLDTFLTSKKTDRKASKYQNLYNHCC
uniref:Uncharacterized protein n=1 Tax=Oryza punctata TaxID=4537 RepID=A0A0E0K0C8_ORYPU